MGDTRLGDRICAAFLLAASVLAFIEAALVLELGSDGPLANSGTGAAALLAALPAVFAAGAAACFLGTLWFWRLSGRAAQEPAGALPLFGRNADMRPAGAPRLRYLLLALPVIVLAAAGVNHAALWKAEPPAAEVPAPVLPTPEDDAPAPVAADPLPPLPAGSDLGTPPPDLVAAAPATPAEAEPPVTTAPLPESEPLPTEAGGHHDAVVWLDVAFDGRTLLSASTDRTVKLWDIDARRLIRDLGAHKDMARTALFLPDGARAVTAGDDGEIVLRALADGAVLHVFSAGGNGGVNKLAISPDGRRAVSGHDTGAVIVWDIANGAALHVLTGHEWSISSVAVSPDGSRALTSSIDGELRLWDIGAGKLLRRWQGHERGAYGALFTADGHHAVTGSGDYTIKLWDLDTGKEVRRFTGHSGTVYALALSADGTRLLSGSLDGSARLWDMATGGQTALFDPGTGPILAVAFAGDGSALTGGGDRTIRRWPVAGGDGAVLFAGAP